jgi:hypothetical protein
MTRPDGHGGSGRISGVLGERAPCMRTSLGAWRATCGPQAPRCRYHLSSELGCPRGRSAQAPDHVTRGAKQPRLLGPVCQSALALSKLPAPTEEGA